MVIKKSDSSGIIACLSVAGLVILTRFCFGILYRPVMDDWFLYGDIYENKLLEFIIPNEKFAIRPLAGLIDIFVVSPLFSHIWIAELCVSVMLAAGAFIYSDILRKNNFPAGALFLTLLCLSPINMEATYWLAASIRISGALFFSGAACWCLNEFMRLGRKGFYAAYSALGFAAVSFYEAAVVLYVCMVLCLVFANENKKYIFLLAPVMAHLIYISAYYILNGSSLEMEARGHLLTSDFLNHTRIINKSLAEVLTTLNWRAFAYGLKKGFKIIIGGKMAVETLFAAALSGGLGLAEFKIMKYQKAFSIKRLAFYAVLFLSGIMIFYVLENTRFAIRFAYFAFVGIGLVAEEGLLLLPHRIRVITGVALVSVSAFLFSVADVGIAQQYYETSKEDERIVRQIFELDESGFAVNPDKNTYVLGAQTYYNDIESVKYMESIRGACSGYADMTGCMRHLSGISNTNNLTPVADGETINLAVYDAHSDICKFFALDEDMNVINVSVIKNGEKMDIVQENNTLYGIFTEAGNGQYIFEKR